MPRTHDNTDAVNAFIAAKIKIDAMLLRLQELSEDHFDTAPEDVDYGHVGTLNMIEHSLRQVTDFAFQEGECAG